MPGPKAKSLAATLALPNGAASTVSNAMDLGTYSEFLGDAGTITLALPSLTTSQLPDGKTITYSVEGGVNDRFDNLQTILSGAAVQTGAGGAGADSNTVTLSFPRKLVRFVRVRATNSGAGDASGATASADIEF